MSFLFCSCDKLILQQIKKKSAFCDEYSNTRKCKGLQQTCLLTQNNFLEIHGISVHHLHVNKMSSIFPTKYTSMELSCLWFITPLSQSQYYRNNNIMCYYTVYEFVPLTINVDGNENSSDFWQKLAWWREMVFSS